MKGREKGPFFSGAPFAPKKSIKVDVDASLAHFNVGNSLERQPGGDQCDVKMFTPRTKNVTPQENQKRGHKFQ